MTGGTAAMRTIGGDIPSPAGVAAEPRGDEERQIEAEVVAPGVRVGERGRRAGLCVAEEVAARRQLRMDQRVDEPGGMELAMEPVLEQKLEQRTELEMRRQRCENPEHRCDDEHVGEQPQHPSGGQRALVEVVDVEHHDGDGQIPGEPVAIDEQPGRSAPRHGAGSLCTQHQKPRDDPDQEEQPEPEADAAPRSWSDG